MRIMLTADTVGGVWHYTTELAAGFATRGIETLIVAMGPPPSPAQRAEASAVNGCELRSTGLGLDWLAAGPDEVRRAAVELAEIAADWGADTVQLHSPAYAAAANWPAPLVAAAHSCVATWWQAIREGPLPVHLAWRADLTADGLVTADAVIAPSHSFADMLTRTYALHREIRVIWNGRKQIPMQRTPHPHGFTAGRCGTKPRTSRRSMGPLVLRECSCGQPERLLPRTGRPFTRATFVFLDRSGRRGWRASTRVRLSLSRLRVMNRSDWRCSRRPRPVARCC
jgi:hypothetical protein